jgi:hypothetical protein
MAKGVDLVGWRPCKKQQELGPKRFALTLKRLGRQATDGRSLPPPPASSMSLSPEQKKRLQQHQELRQAKVQFDQGTPECPACPLSGGGPYGCWVAVDYPIDGVAETALFSYFVAQMDDERSICTSLYRDRVSKIPTEGTPWHKDRGPTGSLCEMEAPLVRETGFWKWKKHVDSAQILGSLFFNLTRVGTISAFATFWEGFIQHARQTIPDFESSGTLMQLEHLAHFYVRVAEAASTTEGVSVVVENDAPSVVIGAPAEESKS